MRVGSVSWPVSLYASVQNFSPDVGLQIIMIQKCSEKLIPRRVIRQLRGQARSCEVQAMAREGGLESERPRSAFPPLQKLALKCL